jgi:hypothetical protein
MSITRVLQPLVPGTVRVKETTLTSRSPYLKISLFVELAEGGCTNITRRMSTDTYIQLLCVAGGGNWEDLPGKVFRAILGADGISIIGLASVDDPNESVVFPQV